MNNAKPTMLKRNQNSCQKKAIRTVFLVLVAWALILRLPRVVRAAEFETNYHVVYTVTDSGSTHVRQEIQLTNLTADHYASNFTLSLNQPPRSAANQPTPNPNPETQNVAAFNSAGQSLTAEVKNGDITVKFDNLLIGQGRSRKFRIEYDTNQIAQKVGRLWEINIPTLQNSSQNSQISGYSVLVTVPQNFGRLHYATPEPEKEETTTNSQEIHFSLESDAAQPIVLVFGDYQVYDFKLQYHLLNSQLDSLNRFAQIFTQTEPIPIALPPDFKPYQEVFVRSLEPSPEKIEYDADGNILAYYQLNSRKRLDITYQGQIKINAAAEYQSTRAKPTPSEQSSSTPTNYANYIIPDKYWQSNDASIQELAHKLQTPHAIYDFVTQNLVYDETRIGDNISRFGAVQALKDKEHAVCMEYTDLTIALMRAANIPAREVNGYAYTGDTLNPSANNRPTLTDVLHAWVMFYERESNRWRQIDPTWGSTTRRDYFNHLDTNHIIFVIKGLNSERPYPAGAYKGNNPNHEDVKIIPAAQIASDVQPFKDWLGNFNYQHLPWWEKLVLWLRNLFGIK